MSHIGHFSQVRILCAQNSKRLGWAQAYVATYDDVQHILIKSKDFTKDTIDMGGWNHNIN
jgi:hypothetical protein